MKVLFFDTETTGLPRNWKAPMKDLDNWPRVIQLAWIVCMDGKVVMEAKYLIKPDGWKIPVEKFWIDNGFNQAKSESEGFPINDILRFFLTDHDACDFMVSHNMSFDYNVLGSEMIRAKKQGNKYLKKQRQNQKYLMTLIQIKTSPNWDGKQIRAHVQEVLTEAIAQPA